MPTYNLTARKTSPLTPITLDAATREDAIAQVVSTAVDGETIQVLQCIEAIPGEPPAGATGTSSRKKD